MKKKSTLVIIAIVILAVILAYNFYSMKTRNAVEELIRDKKMINILVAGANKYHRNKHRFFSIVSINPINSKVGITFIPPSYRVRVGGDHYEKIEDIDFLYYDRIRDTFRENLKMNVPFYLKLYSEDVVRIVNLLEGVDLFVLDQVDPKMGPGFGIHYFDGNKTMRYINEVPDKSIYIKYDRVLDILYSMYDRKDQYKRLHNPVFIAELFRSIKTNLMPQELYELGRIIYDEGGMIATLLPGGMENDMYVTDEISYRIYEKEFLQGIILDKKTDPLIKVKLLNGTDTPGLARKMRNLLIRDGINVLEFGTSPYEKLDYSIIINRRGNYDAVLKVAETTGISKIHHVIDSTELNNVMVIIGKDYASDNAAEKK